MPDVNYRLNALLTQGRHAEVIALYQSLPRPERRRTDTINLYACALMLSARHQEAFRILNAVPYRQKNPEIWNNLCLAGMQLQRFEDTLVLLDRALKRFPDDQSLHLIRSRCLGALGRPEAAHHAARAALAIEEDETALFAAGRTAEDLGRYEEAMAFYRGTLRLNPARAVGADNLYRLCWQLRRFSDVRALVEPVLNAPAGKESYARFLAADCPPWTGGRLDGRLLHVIADQGVGDQIMFTQFLGRLGAFGAGQVVVHLEPRLVPLFREGFRSDFAIAFKPFQARIDCRPADMKVPLSMLPNYFVRSAEDFPRKAFLSPDAGSSDLRGADPGPLFGLAWWSAGLASDARSLDVTEIAEALQATGARFLSLQYRPADAGIERLQALLGDRLIVPEGLDCTDDFLGVAKICLQLDGVLTVPQALVHVAGAVGASVGVLLPEDPSWRYHSPDETMLWYGDHVRLIKKDGTKSLAERVASYVPGMVSSRT